MTMRSTSRAALVMAGCIATACGAADSNKGRAGSSEALDAEWQALSDVQACLDGRKSGPTDPATGWTVCALPAGTFNLDGRIIPGGMHPYIDVGTSRHVLRGASKSGTVIARAANTPGLQALVFVDGNVGDVSIEQLTINGNRFAQTTNWNGATFPAGCFPSNDSYIDLNIQPNVLPNVRVHEVSLLNGPSTSMQHTQNVQADGLFISSARSTGIHMFGVGGSVTNSIIERSGTAGITVHGTGSTVRNVQLNGNRREQPDGVPGGQLNLEPESVSATIDQLTIDGQDWIITGAPIDVTDALTSEHHACPAFSNDGHFPMGLEGIEGYGERHTLTNITSKRNAATGMILKGTQYWRLSDNVVDGNGAAGTGAGIAFLPYLGQSNVGMVLHNTTIINTRLRNGLQLQDMELGVGGVGGCDGTTVIANNPVNVEVNENVDPKYVNTCKAGTSTGCDECQVSSGSSCTPAPNGSFCANGTKTCHNGTCAEAFTDVPAGSAYHDFIVDMLRRGITSGCAYDPSTGDRSYCPDAGHTRAEAAVFIVRARNLSAPDPSHGLLGGAPDNFQCRNASGQYVACADASVPTRFTDVPKGHWAYAWIQKLVELGITKGCSATGYCPDTSLELYDTTVFVERGQYGCTSDNACDGAIGYPSSPIFFSDMTNPQDAYFRFIQNAGSVGRWCGKADGSGYPFGRYGLYDTISRRQAAALIERSFFGGARCTAPE